MSLQIWYQFLILHVKYKALKIQEKLATEDSTNLVDLHKYSSFYESALLEQFRQLLEAGIEKRILL